jgi:putative membrane protein
MRKVLAILVLCGGLAAGALLVLAYGLDDVGAALGAVGWSGFVAICAVHGGFVALRGGAWWALAAHAGPPTFIWARLIRDAGADLLPLSQVGGYAMGARAATLRGVPAPVAIASTVVDVTLETATQLAYTALGLGLLVTLHPGSAIVYPAALGLAGAALLIVAFVVAQRRGFAALARLAGRALGGVGTGAAAVHEAIGAIYCTRAGLALSLLLHGAAWFAAAAESWLALRFMGAPLALAAVVALESLISAIRSVAFAVPNALGVQEGGYIALGAVFGLPPEIALALSLLRRARDLAFGAPALLAWPLAEGRRAFRTGAI